MATTNTTDPTPDRRTEAQPDGSRQHPVGDGARLALVHVIVNPKSGNATDGEHIAETLRSQGAGGVVVVPTTKDDPGAGQTKAAIAAGATLVVVCGGDGTVRACAGALAGSGTPLAVIPAGTGNLLARNLGISTDADEAIDVAVNGTTKEIDLGEAGGEVFTVMAGIGFDAMMIRDTNTTWKARVGSLAYVASALRHLRSRPTAVQVDISDPPERANLSGPATMVLAGNLGTLTGGLTAFPDADPTDGSLEIALLNASSLRAWLGVLVTMVSGRASSTKRVHRSRATTMTIRSSRPRPWELDGEDRPAVTELRITVRPKALVVCVPAGAAS